MASRAWRGVALLLSCLLVYSRLGTPPTAVAHTAAPPAAKHRPPPLDLPPTALSTSTPPPLASAAPARHATADVPKRRATEREAHSGAPSDRATPPEAVHHELAADTIVHVALAADSHHFQALPGAILSAANRTSAPLAFHVIVPAEQLAAATSALECFGVATTPTPGDSAAATSAPGCPSVAVLPFDSALDAPVRVVAKPDVTGNLASPLNFARSELPRLLPARTLTLTLTLARFELPRLLPARTLTLTLSLSLSLTLTLTRFELPRLLPSLRRLLYLDPDVVVQADLLELWQRPLGEGDAVGAAPRTLTLTLALTLALALTLTLTLTRWARSPAPSRISSTSGTRPSAPRSTASAAARRCGPSSPPSTRASC
jgi:hypothetical protein